MAQVVSIASLREQIRKLEGQVPVDSQRVRSGVDALDGLLGGLMRPGLVEVTGPPGCGAVRLALHLAAAETSRRRRVAWIDLECSLYPPTARAYGVDLGHLVIIRVPSGTTHGGQHPGTWTTEQVMRSGCFRLVITTECPSKTPRFAGTRWRRAAEAGGCTGLFISRTRAQSRVLQPDVRVAIDAGRMIVTRDRQRGPGAIGWLPTWPQHTCP